MTIIFKTRDGRTVETTDKNVLIAAAKNGEIGPDTVLTIDGEGVNAGRIKELVFGAPAPAPKPAPAPAPAPAPSTAEKTTASDPLPKPVRAAFEWLGFGAVCPWGFAAVIWIFVAMYWFSEGVIAVAFASLGGAVCCALNAKLASCVLEILEYIAVNVTKKDDK